MTRLLLSSARLVVDEVEKRRFRHIIGMVAECKLCIAFLHNVAEQRPAAFPCAPEASRVRFITVPAGRHRNIDKLERNAERGENTAEIVPCLVFPFRKIGYDMYSADRIIQRVKPYVFEEEMEQRETVLSTRNRNTYPVSI